MERSPPHQTSKRRWRGRVGATALSAGAHVALVAALLIGWRTTAPPAIQPAVDVSFGPALALAKPPAPPSSAKATPQPAAAAVAPARPAAPPPLAARPSPAPPAPESPPAATMPAKTAGSGSELSDAQLAGAQVAGEGQGASAGSGGDGGGDCDMARRVQTALRKDPLARTAVHGATGRAIVIWNGDWVQAGEEDGKGLAAVREAITWEVAFAPAACRAQRVRGLVLLSLNDGSARLAVGAGDWRWSDLLGLR